MGAKAQENETYAKADTLTMQQLMADYVSQNKEIAEFRTYEITSIGLGATAGVMGIASMLWNTSRPMASKTLLIISGAAAIGSIAMSIMGYDKLKHDRLELTPDGFVVKLNKTEGKKTKK